CTPLLIDTCGGFELVQQLHAVGYGLEDLEHVVLTHRHGDHIGGTMALLMRPGPWNFHGPDDALKAVTELAAATYPEWRLSNVAGFHTVTPERIYDIGGFSVTFFEVEHRVPTVAVRVSHAARVLAYSADSLPCDALIDCARDADLFICDALSSRSEGEARLELTRQLMHPTAFEAGSMAAEARAKALALVHFGTSAEPEPMIADAAVAYSGPITAPSDGTGYRLE
ncbi:MAG TPA: MBL fold metallo-hydrolase, partial [Trueperaceae bacterium]|nr:MBL fold metallo-hydrolase [Trueperaceae bacterium]